MSFELNLSDTLGPLGGGDLGESFVTPEECAQRMGITVEQVAEMVRRGVLRSDRCGYVQPAILSGVVPHDDN